MRIRTSRETASRSCTTASSRITRSCAPSSSATGYTFSSETDTEVIAHRIHHHLKTVGDLFEAVRATVAELEGAYALAVVSEHDPDRMILAREGCPVVIGLGVEENFVASDVAALLPVTRRFVFLEEGDVARDPPHLGAHRRPAKATASIAPRARAICPRTRRRRGSTATSC